MLNPYFRDGTRLRVGPLKEKDAFSGEHILNDAEVEIIEVLPGFVRVQACDEFGSPTPTAGAARAT